MKNKIVILSFLGLALILGPAGAFAQQAENKKEHPENGVEKTYYESKALQSERMFKDGKPDGRAIFYYENGKIMTEVNYVNGKRDGFQRSYYENGKLKEEMELSNGKLNGVHKEYDEQGKVTSEKYYESSVLVDKKKK